MPQHQSPTPKSDLVELAILLAIGIVRLRSQPRVAADTSLEVSESTSPGLEFPDESRLTVPTG